MTARTPRPPIPPRLDRWPEAVRSAELIRGTVVRCGPGLRLTAWPETPSVRAAALRPLFRDDLIASHITAAWIWGAARNPGEPLDFLTLNSRTQGTEPETGIRLHRFRMGNGDIAALGGLNVTTPRRTLFDLLRGDQFSTEQRLVCRVLLAFLPECRAWLRDRLESSRASHPYHQRIRARLGDETQPVVR